LLLFYRRPGSAKIVQRFCSRHSGRCFEIRIVFADVCQCQKMSFDASPRFVAEKMLRSNKHFRVGLSSAAFLMSKLNHCRNHPHPHCAAATRRLLTMSFARSEAAFRRAGEKDLLFLMQSALPSNPSLLWAVSLRCVQTRPYPGRRRGC